MCQIPLTPQELSPGHPVRLVLIRPSTRCVSKPFSILVERHEESNKFCPCHNVAPIRMAAKSEQEPLEGSSTGNRRRNPQDVDSTGGASSAKKMRQKEEEEEKKEEKTSSGLQELFDSMLSNEESNEYDARLLDQGATAKNNKLVFNASIAFYEFKSCSSSSCSCCCCCCCCDTLEIDFSRWRI